MVRDYIYVKDLVDMIKGVFSEDDLKDVYNMGSGKGTTINELIQIAEMVTGKKPEVIKKPTPSTFLQDVVLNTDKFAEDFHIQPTTSLEVGMRATYEYIKNEIQSLELGKS